MQASRRGIISVLAAALVALVVVASPPQDDAELGASSALQPSLGWSDVSFRLPELANPTDEGLWVHWVDSDGDGTVDSRPSYNISWGDVNGDGLLDIFLNNHAGDRFGPEPSLYVNQGDGTFADELHRFAPGVDGTTVNGDRHGSVWTDIDNDGDEDLLVLVGLNRDLERSFNKLYINNSGFLVDVALERGLQYGESRAREPALLDLNGDGLLDLLHGSLIDGQKDPELPPALFVQNGDGTFTDVTDAAGYTYNEEYGLEHAAVADLDGDGNVEIIQKQPFTIFTNRDGVLVDVTGSFFTAIRPENDRGLTDFAVADFNGDAVLDLFIPSWTTDGHQLIVSSANGWVDASDAAGLSTLGFRTTDGSGVGTGDFDNDGDVDMVVLDRNVGGVDYVLTNDGSGSFAASPLGETAVTTVLDRPDHRSISIADYDNDGDLDFLETTSNNDPTYRLIENEGTTNSWLGIELIGTSSNRDAIGASVYVTAGGSTQVRHQHGGLHFRVQDDKRIHFGLGDGSSVDEVRVVWPDGTEQVFTDLDANQRIQIVEGDDMYPANAPLLRLDGCMQCVAAATPVGTYAFALLLSGR